MTVDSSATIPVQTMKADPELYALATTPEWPMWMGDACSVLGTSVILKIKHRCPALTLDRLLSSPRLSNGVFPYFIGYHRVSLVTVVSTKAKSTPFMCSGRTASYIRAM